MLFLSIILSALLIVNCQSNGSEPYTLNILHYNDFHARFKEISAWGGTCESSDNQCIGGFARLATVIRQRMLEEPDSILLNAGDSFQGTIWYNLLRWNVTQEFMNMLPHDAHTLGNHEFDNGIAGVVPYIEHLNASVVVANIIDDLEPSMQGIYKKSIVVQRKGRKIGIIGVLIASTPTLASTERLEFTDEIETVRAEAEKLNSEGVDIIVVLSHCGIELDREIAEKGGPYIDIVVGGHSHTLLYTGVPPDTSAFTPSGPYPVVVDNEGRKVLIVQVGAHTVFLGEIQLTIDEQGHLVDWQGNPHYMAHEIEQDPEVLEKLAKYQPIIDEEAKKVLGHSMVHMSSNCACAECNLGSFICESFLYAALDYTKDNNWSGAHFCVINQGGVRADITPGVITIEQATLAQPFENNVELFDLRGDHVMEMLEFATKSEPYPGSNTLQFAGLRVHIDGSRPANDRVVSVSVRCIECDVPRYEPLDRDKYYTVVSQSFLTGGGDGFDMIPEHRINEKVIGVDSDILNKYIEHQSPVFLDVDGRLRIDSPCMN